MLFLNVTHLLTDWMRLNAHGETFNLTYKICLKHINTVTCHRGCIRNLRSVTASVCVALTIYLSLRFKFCEIYQVHFIHFFFDSQNLHLLIFYSIASTKLKNPIFEHYRIKVCKYSSFRKNGFSNHCLNFPLFIIESSKEK